MTAKLIAEEGILKGLVLNLEEGDEWIIGRDPDECQLLIEDPAASRKHVLCRSTPEGILVENLSETNPVHINEEEITEPRILHHGDTITIGNGIFRFYSEVAATVEDLPEEQPSEHPEEIEEEEKHDTIFEEEQAEEEEQLLAEIDLGLTERGNWLLKVIAGPNNGAEFSMEPDTDYTLGTEPASCDIVFQDVSVSRQHARLFIHSDETLSIEDLNSSNGTLIEGEKIEGKQPLEPNTIISLGTTSFIVYNLEGERNTVISPLLPAIVKVLQESEKKKAEEMALAEAEGKVPEEAMAEEAEEKPLPFFSNKVLTGIIAAIALFGIFSITTLFVTEEIVTPERDPIKEIELVLLPFPDLKYTYFEETGRIFLTGHVLTSSEKNKLIYNLNIMPFIREIDDRIIIDENIWQETNLVLAKNPDWHGIAIHSPSAGRFVISGYLENNQQADTLSDYLTQNFPYSDRLEQRIVVDEEVSTKTSLMLFDRGFRDVSAKTSNGEVTLEGAIPAGNRTQLESLIKDVKAISGVRSVKNFIVELPVEETLVNISGKYNVTGSLTQNDKISVVVQGRILSTGSFLDGMKITKITKNRIHLEKGGIKYIIEY